MSRAVFTRHTPALILIDGSQRPAGLRQQVTHFFPHSV